MNLALIPARGGSKRIPQKNIKPFLGRPIITYSIRTAIDSDLFDEVMVSTDCNEVAAIALAEGAKVPFVRSKENSGDFATTAQVIKEVLEEYHKRGVTFKNVCCIYPTAPFVSAGALISSFDVLASAQVDSVFPIQNYSYPIWRSFSMSEEGLLRLNFPENLNKRSQDLESAYHDAGQYYWLNVESFLRTEQIFTDKSIGVVINNMQAQDIDNPEDWELAEMKFKVNHR